MKVLLATVEHTGTRFFAGLIARVLGAPRIAGSDYYDHVADGPTFVVTHVQHRSLIERYVSEFSPVVVTTIRNLDAVYASYVRRNVAEDLPRYLSDWMWLVGAYSPLIVSVDSADRETRLDRLVEVVGVTRPASWHPVTEWPN